MIISALLGFVAPHLGTVINLGEKFLQQRNDLSIAKIKAEAAKMGEESKVQVAEIEAQTKEFRIAHKQNTAFGIQLLNAASSSDAYVGKFLFGMAFFLYSVIDWVDRMVRPLITFMVVGLWAYMLYKSGLTQSWNDFDYNLVSLVTAYWFSDITLRRKMESLV